MSSNNNNSNVTYADKVGIATIKISAAAATCTRLMRAGLVPNLIGDAGIGKTAIAKQIARALNAHLVMKTVSQMSASDFAIGFREPDSQSFKMLLSEWLTEVLEVSETGKPVLLFLDEITRYQDTETAAVIFAMISEGDIYGKKFPSNVMMMSACNPMDGDYSVNDIMTDPAWRRRLCHVAVETDAQLWLDYAMKNNFNKAVIDYIICNPNMLLDTAARSAGKIYTTPASWEKVSKYLDANPGLGYVPVADIASLIGIDVASNFASFVDNAEYKLDPSLVWSDWPKAKKILDKMTADNRHDLVMGTVSAVGTMILLSQPDIDTAVPNLAKFWASLPDEAMVKLNLLLSQRTSEQASYYAQLMANIQKTTDWATNIYKRMQSATK